jgi:hypothetical protein
MDLRRRSLSRTHWTLDQRKIRATTPVSSVAQAENISTIATQQDNRIRGFKSYPSNFPWRSSMMMSR